MPKIVDHDERRRELARVVLKLVRESGFEEVSIRSVAAASGWSRGVVEHYFRDRDDLLIFAYREALARMVTAIEEDAGAIADPVDRLISFLMRTLPSGPDERVDFSIWLALLGRASIKPAVAEALYAETEAPRSFFVDAFAECVDQGLLRPAGTVEDAVDMLLTFTNGLGVEALFQPKQVSSEFLDRKLRQFMAGWSPSP